MKWIRFPGAHNKKRFEDVYEEYYGAVYNYVYRILLHRQNTEDVVSKTFFKAMQAFPRYDGTEKTLLAWLCRIARNCSINFLKSEAVRKSVSLEGLGDLPAGAWGTDTPEWEAWEILRRLSVEERELLTMRYWLELSNREIAQKLGVTEGAVKARLHRLLEKCRELANRT